MTDKQKELLEKIIKSPRGTILQKGKTRRILWGVMPGMIAYKTFRSKKIVTAVLATDFLKWAEKAEFVTQSED